MAPGLVGELAGDGEAVGGIAGSERLGEAVGRFEEGELEGDAQVDDPVAQDVDRAAVVELGRKPLGEAPLGSVGIVAVAAEERLPLVNLGGADEGEQL